jgi:hypothetical protein
MLSPKEKAAELISKFRQIPPFSSYTGIGYSEAKQCALVALHETVWGYLNQLPVEIQDYWQEVKQEILLH